MTQPNQYTRGGAGKGSKSRAGAKLRQPTNIEVQSYPPRRPKITGGRKAEIARKAAIARRK